MASSSRSRSLQVFPSFRGKDVRQTFLSHLIVALDRKLVCTVFKDSQIERGHSISPALVQAIRDSRVSIVVLSKNYASSSWCLDELLEILKCREELGQIVMTIFYDLDPSDVRYQIGEFGKAFEKTCEKKTADVTKQWGLALTEVANIHGHHSRKWDSEAHMVDDFVNDVSCKLNCSQSSSEEFDDLIGIEAHIANMVSLLSMDAEQVLMVGIWGPSGIGKSTIARALFGRLSYRFQRCVFIDRSFIDKTLENFRRINLDDYGVKLQLQEKFLSEILDHKDVKIDHLGVLGGRLQNHKVLIVLDDVDDRLLLDALVGQTLWFGSGSRIIVVTKDVHLLRSHGIERVYEVGFPSEDQALEMFCQSAFKRNSPADGFMDLAVEVSKLAGNLPLGLNLLGSSLRGRNKEDWIDMLPELRTCLNGDIERTLRFGYDRLKETHKRLFLHIACLFNGEKVDSLKWLLADSDVDVNTGLRVLVERSLIRITTHLCKTVEMHNLLQEMGRGMVSAQSFDEPGERQFLTDSKNICDVLEDNSGTKAVLGISWNISEIAELFTLDEDAFKGMRNLRFLKIYKNPLERNEETKLYLPQGIQSLSRRLRLLHWDAYPMSRMPSDFSPAYLVELGMIDSELEKMWEGPQPLKYLKNMSLWRSKKLKEVPDLSKAPNLEELYLADCQSLEMLPSSIRYLKNLKTLNMEECSKLEFLPTNINLESLSNLTLYGCSLIRSFPDISHNISVLSLENTAIEEVPWWIEKMTGLTGLFMSGCGKLSRISPNISKLKHLEDVDFSLCYALTEDSWQDDPQVVPAPNPIGDLDMSDNTFTRLPHSLVSIKPQELNIGNCRKLVSLPELQTSSLKILRAQDCESLESISHLFRNPETILHFINCFKLEQECLIRSSVFKYMILPGRQVPPEYFTHRASGSYLTIPLLESFLHGSFLRFKACLLIDTDSTKPTWVKSIIRVCCLLKGNQGNHFHSSDLHILIFVTRLLDRHLAIFDCSFPLDNPLAKSNYDAVEIKFGWDACEIKECGIQFFSPSSDSQPGDANKLSEENSVDC
ncbi:disease resistance protein RPS6 [Brassica rapa]|uniref:ADP-ribosyl cyclase/cyclic ADP-ribose hydrolase n=2 Tax=Brassica campestris TaxID=3711 RepID=M4CY44_BRACM|nr:disease resistance protein RPS6 [Brassica rapa]ACP30611.1 disease resistance protein [Brassica rapa subsp. pekinensis]